MADSLGGLLIHEHITSAETEAVTDATDPVSGPNIEKKRIAVGKQVEVRRPLLRGANIHAAVIGEDTEGRQQHLQGLDLVKITVTLLKGSGNLRIDGFKLCDSLGLTRLPLPLILRHVKVSDDGRKGIRFGLLRSPARFLLRFAILDGGSPALRRGDPHLFFHVFRFLSHNSL